MVDAPSRATRRFPPEEVPRVAREVQGTFERWGVGPQTTLVAGGARGADILAAEAAAARGATLRLVLSAPPDEFERSSVELPASDWVPRFRALLTHANVEVIDDPERDDVFERTNRRILEIARALDPAPFAVVVWDGGDADGPGGTRDFLSRLGADDPGRLRIIDPRPGTSR